MLSKQELSDRWQVFQGMSFPKDIAGEEFAGVCVASVDSFVAGCISSVIAGRLAPEKIVVFEQCVAELSKALPQIPESAQSYFATLEELALAALDSCR